MKKIIFDCGILLLLFVIGIACQEKDTYDHGSIVGKWQIIQYPEYCIGFGDKVIEFTPDSIFTIYVDGKLTFKSIFNIKTGSMGYDTIIYNDHTGYYSWELIALKGSDTIRLIPPILTALPICDHYKRKK